MRNLKWMVLFVLLLAIILGACSSKESGSKVVGSEEGTDTISKEQVLKVNNFTEPSSLNPSLATDVWSSNILLQTFEGLTRINQKGVPENAMAEKIAVSDDLLTYTFTLRDGAKWSNGEPVTMNDFEYAWKWVLNPENLSQYAYQLFYVKNAEAANKGEVSLEEIGVKAIDEKTLEVTLENPTPFFLELTAFYTYFPINSKIAEGNPDWAKEASKDYTSNGPFKMVKWDHQNQVILEKNQHYWDKENVKLEKIEMVMLNDSNTELNMFNSDELHWAGAPTGSLPLEAIPALQQEGALEAAPTAGTYWYEFNIKKKPFTNVKIRKALAYAIDRQSIVDNITQSAEIPATAIVPNSMIPENEKGYFKDGDIDQAKALLEEGLKEEGYSGVEDLPVITLSYNTDPAQAKIAQAVQDMWKTNLGMNVELSNKEWAVYYEGIINGDFEVARMGWTGDFNDPINFLEIFKNDGGNNHTGWMNEEYASLLDQSALESDPSKRKEISKQAEAIIMDEMPVIPFYFKTSVYVKKDNLKGVYVSGLGNVQYKWAYFE